MEFVCAMLGEVLYSLEKSSQVNNSITYHDT